MSIPSYSGYTQQGLPQEGVVSYLLIEKQRGSPPFHLLCKLRLCGKREGKTRWANILANSCNSRCLRRFLTSWNLLKRVIVFIFSIYPVQLPTRQNGNCVCLLLKFLSFITRKNFFFKIDENKINKINSKIFNHHL